MHKYNIIKLLRLQDKNINLDKCEINSKTNSALFYISKKVTAHSCPCCGTQTKRIHDHRLQIIKHTPINNYSTKLVLKKTRLICTNCGKKFYMNYTNIVNPKFRCSNSLFFKIIEDLNSSITFSDVAKLNNVSTGVVIRYLLIFSYLMGWNSVTRLPKHIGIDEFKGNCNNSKYLFHVFDLDTSETIQILETRKSSDIIDFFSNISNRNEVKIVTMDLYQPFKNAVQTKLKRANIVADRFHYTSIVAKYLDKLRLNLWRNSNDNEKKYFKNLKLALLKDIKSVDKDNIAILQEKLMYAFDLSPDLKYAYNLYQTFLKIKYCSNYKEKCTMFRNWLDDALSCTIDEMKTAAETLLKWNKEILNSFKTSYTNSSTEGKNNKIKVIKRIAYGYKNLDNFRNRIKLRDLKV